MTILSIFSMHILGQELEGLATPEKYGVSNGDSAADLSVTFSWEIPRDRKCCKNIQLKKL